MIPDFLKKLKFKVSFSYLSKIRVEGSWNTQGQIKVIGLYTENYYCISWFSTFLLSTFIYKSISLVFLLKGFNERVQSLTYSVLAENSKSMPKQICEIYKVYWMSLMKICWKGEGNKRAPPTELIKEPRSI